MSTWIIIIIILETLIRVIMNLKKEWCSTHDFHSCLHICFEVHSNVYVFSSVCNIYNTSNINQYNSVHIHTSESLPSTIHWTVPTDYFISVLVWCSVHSYDSNRIQSIRLFIIPLIARAVDSSISFLNERHLDVAECKYEFISTEMTEDLKQEETGNKNWK